LNSALYLTEDLASSLFSKHTARKLRLERKQQSVVSLHEIKLRSFSTSKTLYSGGIIETFQLEYFSVNFSLYTPCFVTCDTHASIPFFIGIILMFKKGLMKIPLTVFFLSVIFYPEIETIGSENKTTILKKNWDFLSLFCVLILYFLGFITLGIFPHFSSY